MGKIYFVKKVGYDNTIGGQFDSQSRAIGKATELATRNGRSYYVVTVVGKVRPLPTPVTEYVSYE